MDNGTTALKERISVATLKEQIEERRKETEVVKTLPVANVRPWPDQPRKFFNKESIKDLARSIDEVGQKVPIMVTADINNPGHYSIDDGERRWRACRLLNRRVIQAIVLPQESDDDRLVRSVVANFGGEGHTPYEVALVLRRIHGTGKYSVPQIAAMFTRSDCWVYQRMSLIKLDQRVIAMMDCNIPFESRLKFAIAILLTTLPDDLQFEIAKVIVDNKMRLTAARHYVEVKAAEKEFKVGGIASRPMKRRESLVSLLTGMAESLPTFLNVPDIALDVFLASFSIDDLARVVEKSEQCQKGMEIICRTAKTVQEAARAAQENSVKSQRKKQKKQKNNP